MNANNPNQNSNQQPSPNPAHVIIGTWRHGPKGGTTFIFTDDANVFGISGEGHPIHGEWEATGETTVRFSIFSSDGSQSFANPFEAMVDPANNQMRFVAKTQTSWSNPWLSRIS